MIEQKTLRDITSDMRNNFQTAMSAVEKNNIDYAILLLKSLIQKEPGFMDAREQLRKVEKIKTKSLGFIAKTMAGMKAGGLATKGKALLVKDPKKAMRMAEDALSIILSNIPALKLLAESGQALEAHFIAIEALEIAAEYYPENESVLNWLAEIYAELGMGGKALQIRQQIAALDPGNMTKQQAVRAAAALATIEQGNLEQDDFRKSLKDENQAVKAEQDDRIVRDINDVKELIDEYEQKIAEGDASVETYRKLAEMYQRGGEHDKALENYNIVVEKMGTLDPYIDKAIEKSTVANFMARIKEWEEYAESNPDKKEEAEKNIEELNRQKLDYQLERALARVNLYPNDTELRFELAKAYWATNNVDEALKQFQIAQKNPHRRLTSLIYLGRCFQAKGQYDIAVEQFEQAVEGLVAMNKEKMDALYHLGVTYESMGNTEKAAETFKQIYQANVSFRDVAERMEKLYKK